MKSLLALVCALCAAVAVSAQPAPPGKAAEKAPPAPAKKETTKKDAKDTKATKAKEDEMGKIEGIELSRADGTFLGLTLTDGKFKLTFYDKKKKPTKVNVLRATGRWPNVHGPGQNRAVLNVAGDGTYMTSAQFVRGPYTFVLILSLIKSEDGTEAETYTVNFHN